jgi:AcrR family transcriptional regulator
MSRPVQLDVRPPAANPDGPGPLLRPAVLSQQLIVDAARQIVAESGTEALTARALSDRLGVSLGSTYHHIRGRDALLALVAQDLYRTVNVPDPSTHWRDYARDLMIQVADVFSQHPGMVAFNVTHPDETHPYAIGDTSLRSVLHRDGFSEDSAQALLAALFFYVNGFLQGGVEAWRSDTGQKPLRQIFINALDLVLDGAAVQLEKAGNSSRPRR